MAFVLKDDGLTSTIIRYVDRKKDGSFQYRRRIPPGLRHKYAGRSFFVRSLQRDISKVYDLASKLTVDLDLQWSLGQRSFFPEYPHPQCSSELEKDRSGKNIEKVRAKAETPHLQLSQALSLYLEHHKNGSKPSFREDCERVIESAIGLLGDRCISAYSRSDAEELRDHWLKRMATRTTRRRLITIVAIVNKTLREKQIQSLNPFEALGIVGEGEDGTKRVPFDNQELRIIAGACRNLDDDIRHIIALQLDTGCRVAEVVGLRVEDVVLGDPVPHLRIRPWGKVRTLKTAASERDLPLIGNALWGAERALEGSRPLPGCGSRPATPTCAAA